MTNHFKTYNDYYEKAQEYREKYDLQTNPMGSGADDEEDAFRHAFASAHMTTITNEGMAKVLGNAQEGIFVGFGSGSTSTNMDKWNNQVGREIGEEIKKEVGDLKNISPEKLDDMIAQKVMEKMEKGDLITDPKDPRKIEDYGKTKQQGKPTGGAAPIHKPKNEEKPVQKPKWIPEKPEIKKKKSRKSEEKIIGYRWVADGASCEACAEDSEPIKRQPGEMIFLPKQNDVSPGNESIIRKV